MRYENITVGDICRISYNRSNDRMRRWNLRTLPEPGTIVKVLKKDRRDYIYPIRIKEASSAPGSEISYTCHPSDLRKEYYKKGSNREEV